MFDISEQGEASYSANSTRVLTKGPSGQKNMSGKLSVCALGCVLASEPRYGCQILEVMRELTYTMIWAER